MMVPSATPRPVMESINKMFNQVTSSEEAKKFFHGVAGDPWTLTVDEADKFVQDEIKKWADWVRIAKIKPQG